MLLLSLDFETTGINKEKDRVIEFGAVLYSSTQRKCLDNQGSLVRTDVPISNEITEITGITQAAVNKFGYDSDSSLQTVIELMTAADYVIGYNVRRFDKPVLENWAKRAGVELPNKLWIDLFADLPWTVTRGKLSHVAADHGILNLFPHSALADCQTVLAILGKYSPELILERAKSPEVVLRSHQERNNNDIVKQAPWKFRWNPPRSIWWKPVKAADVDEVVAKAPFRISIEKELTPEELDN